MALNSIQKLDKYYRRKYNIGFIEYTEMLAKNYGGCWICGSTAKTRRLHVDHSHKVANSKILSYKVDFGKWEAKSKNYVHLKMQAVKRGDAIKAVRNMLKRLSIRGILCFNCNRAIRIFMDSPERLEAAARYLKEYPVNEAPNS